jgi:hypothetical protein
MRSQALPLALAIAAFTAQPAMAALDFEKDIRPLLAGSCFKCHSGTSAKKGFRMENPTEMAKKIGPDGYIVPGKPDASEVIHRIIRPLDDPDRMPPPNRGVKALTEDEVKLVSQWIQEGAVIATGTAAPAGTTAAAPDPKALHQWKSTSGGTIPAFFVKIDGASIVLRSEKGQEKAFAAELFTEESKQLAKSLATATAQP